MSKKVLTIFEEIKKDIPSMCERWGKNGRNGQFLYGDVLDYIRDNHSEIWTNAKDCELLARYLPTVPWRRCCR